MPANLDTNSAEWDFVVQMAFVPNKRWVATPDLLYCVEGEVTSLSRAAKSEPTVLRPNYVGSKPRGRECAPVQQCNGELSDGLFADQQQGTCPVCFLNNPSSCPRFAPDARRVEGAG